MFGLFGKKKILKSGLLEGMTDIHCHLLPAVDDGAENKDEALQALRLMESIGVQRLFFTPHVMEELTSNRADFLRERFERFCSEQSTSIELRLAAEYMLDPAFSERRKEGLLTFNGTHVLVETSYLMPPLGFREILFDLQAEGYQPILAHPERYRYMSPEDYDWLFEHGIALQLNLMSLAGTYGPSPLRRAEDLLAKSYYTFIGSDCHRRDVYERSLQHLKVSTAQLKALNLLVENNKRLAQ